MCQVVSSGDREANLKTMLSSESLHLSGDRQETIKYRSINNIVLDDKRY